MGEKKDNYFSRSKCREIIPFQLLALAALTLTRDNSDM